MEHPEVEQWTEVDLTTSNVAATDIRCGRQMPVNRSDLHADRRVWTISTAGHFLADLKCVNDECECDESQMPVSRMRANRLNRLCR